MKKWQKNKGILCVDTDETSIGWLDGEYKGRFNPKNITHFNAMFLYLLL